MKRLLFILTLIISVGAYGRVQVATTIFPVYDGVRIIGGERIEATLLVKPGVEPHSFEPSPRDIAKINKSEVFLYLNNNMETWIEKFEKNIDVDTVSVTRGIKMREIEEEGDDDHGHHHHHHIIDPHVWLDPVLYIKVVENIAEELIKIDKENEEYYLKNLEDYKRQLEELDKEIAQMVDRSKYNKIIYAGHFSFGYFVDRYNLEYTTVYKNLSPNAKISPRGLQKIIEEVKKSGQNYIFQETLVNSRTAKLIAEETGSEILVLHQLGGIGKGEMKAEKSYLDLMKQNIENLKKGLEYE